MAKVVSPFLITLFTWLIMVSCTIFGKSPINVAEMLFALLLAFLIMGLPLLLIGVRIIREECVVIISLSSKKTIVCGPKIMLIDPILYKVEKLRVPTRLVSYVDVRLADAYIKIVVTYHILDPSKAVDILRSIDNELRSWIHIYLQSVGIGVITESGDKSRIENYLRDSLDKELEPYGIKIYAVEIAYIRKY